MAKKSETGTKKVVVKKSAPARKVGPKGMTFCTLASRDGPALGISGALSAAVSSVTGKRAIVVGKPSTTALKVACERLGGKSHLEAP